MQSYDSQGPETDPAEIAKLRAGMAAGEDVNVYLKNYTKSGVPFFNHVFVCSLKVRTDETRTYTCTHTWS